MDTDQHGCSDLNTLTEAIIGCAYRVANTLGCGFLEGVYENALAHELRKAGLGVQQQASMQVHYDGVVVGDYVGDLLVEESVLLELKACKALDEVHLAQCLNYLKATGVKLGLLIKLRDAQNPDQARRQLDTHPD